jgi:hypothetical protein
MLSRLIVFLPLLVLGACATTPVVPSSAVTPSASPSRAVPSTVPAVAPTPSASAPNRPAHAGSPAIAEPYWLLFNGTSTATFTGADGNVTQTDRGESYQVLMGGSLEGTILMNGEVVGMLEVTITEGESTPGLDPIEQQYGAQIDDVLPTAGVLHPSPNPFWTRTTQQRGGFRVYVRVPAHPTADLEVATDGFWWDGSHEKWYQLSVTKDFASVLTAVLGPESA